MDVVCAVRNNRQAERPRKFAPRKLWDELGQLQDEAGPRVGLVQYQLREIRWHARGASFRPPQSLPGMRYTYRTVRKSKDRSDIIVNVNIERSWHFQAVLYPGMGRNSATPLSFSTPSQWRYLAFVSFERYYCTMRFDVGMLQGAVFVYVVCCWHAIGRELLHALCSWLQSAVLFVCVVMLAPCLRARCDRIVRYDFGILPSVSLYRACVFILFQVG